MYIFCKSNSWSKVRKPSGNWIDDQFDILENAGMTISDFRSSTMNRILKVADKLGVEYFDVDTDEMQATFYIGDEIGSAFAQFLGEKRNVYWKPSDFSQNFEELTVTFLK